MQPDKLNNKLSKISILAKEIKRFKPFNQAEKHFEFYTVLAFL